MTPEQILADVINWKEFGTSSKMPVHTAALEKICRDAIAYQQIPAYIREVAEAVRGQT